MQPLTPQGTAIGCAVAGVACSLSALDDRRRAADDDRHRVALVLAQRQQDPLRPLRRLGRQRQRGERLGRQVVAHQAQPRRAAGRHVHGVDVGDKGPIVDLDAILPVGVAAVARVADLQVILAGRREAIVQEWIAEKEIVVRRQHGADGVAQTEDGIGVLLQVVNAVLQALTAHVKRQRRAGRDLELVEVHVLALFDGAANGRRQGDRLGRLQRIVIGRLPNDGIAHHDDLSQRGGALRRGDAHVAHAEQRFGGRPGNGP